jgi:hypothetical protein
MAQTDRLIQPSEEFDQQRFDEDISALQLSGGMLEGV